MGKGSAEIKLLSESPKKAFLMSKSGKKVFAK